VLLGLLVAACAGACAAPRHGTPEASRAERRAGTATAGRAVHGGATPNASGVDAGAGVTPPKLGSPTELELLDAWPIEGPSELRSSELQPSGLALATGRLLAVSDRQDSVVFALQAAGAKVRALPWIDFHAPAHAGQASSRLDLEGMALDGSGALLLLSEARCAVLRVVQEGVGVAALHSGRASWLPLDAGGPASTTAVGVLLEPASLREWGRAAGLFQVPGADLEGVAALPGGELLLAAERQPRGLIELGRGASPLVRVMEESAWLVPQQRPADFSDLTVVDGRVYALVRNAHLLVRLERTTQGWREERAWSYAATENAPRFVYADTTFGLAEGLAIGPNEIFIVLDNNGQPRRASPADRRALLFRFARPGEL
jgi:hypothetical protein